MCFKAARTLATRFLGHVKRINPKQLFYVYKGTVEPRIASTFTAKGRWPLLGGDRYSEVYYKYGKAFGTEG